MTPLHLCRAQHLCFHGATYSGLHDYICVPAEFAGFICNLLGEFTGRGDDKGADVRGGGAFHAAAFGERRILLKDALEDREEEGNGFTRAGSGLRDAALPYISITPPVGDDFVYTNISVPCSAWFIVADCTSVIVSIPAAVIALITLGCINCLSASSWKRVILGP